MELSCEWVSDISNIDSTFYRMEKRRKEQESRRRQRRQLKKEKAERIKRRAEKVELGENEPLSDLDSLTQDHPSQISDMYGTDTTLGSDFSDFDVSHRWANEEGDILPENQRNDTRDSADMRVTQERITPLRMSGHIEDHEDDPETETSENASPLTPSRVRTVSFDIHTADFSQTDVVHCMTVTPIQSPTHSQASFDSLEDETSQAEDRSKVPHIPQLNTDALIDSVERKAARRDAHTLRLAAELADINAEIQHLQEQNTQTAMINDNIRLRIEYEQRWCAAAERVKESQEKIARKEQDEHGEWMLNVITLLEKMEKEGEELGVVKSEQEKVFEDDVRRLLEAVRMKNEGVVKNKKKEEKDMRKIKKKSKAYPTKSEELLEHINTLRSRISAGQSSFMRATHTAPLSRHAMLGKISSELSQADGKLRQVSAIRARLTKKDENAPKTRTEELLAEILSLDGQVKIKHNQLEGMQEALGSFSGEGTVGWHVTEGVKEMRSSITEMKGATIGYVLKSASIQKRASQATTDKMKKIIEEAEWIEGFVDSIELDDLPGEKVVENICLELIQRMEQFTSM
ncbi:hypothetical protein BLNAU_1820 [Blattamonas nauphoetae]|uniref:Uncharacterized protein n=1 Tax=Blattamonas nauphoetae TaxID=2049346 RepID=A0ABQ9YHQ6_9EUKA|nr:hypothetical protein BLNAU_1820 [Blattamonas nauphoetae]